MFLAPSLDARAKEWARERARRAGIRVVDTTPEVGASEWLGAFDATLAAAGTATLESALAGAPPVIVYRVSALTATLARRLVRTPHVGLPNVVLGSGHYPELLQEEVEPKRVARALADLLDRRTELAPLARELRRRLATQGPLRSSSERVAAFMADWVDGREVDEKFRKAHAVTA
jgi:lipid-A-disaccharide synthase